MPGTNTSSFDGKALPRCAEASVGSENIRGATRFDAFASSFRIRRCRNHESSGRKNAPSVTGTVPSVATRRTCKRKEQHRGTFLSSSSPHVPTVSAAAFVRPHKSIRPRLRPGAFTVRRSLCASIIGVLFLIKGLILSVLYYRNPDLSRENTIKSDVFDYPAYLNGHPCPRRLRRKIPRCSR